MTTELRFPDDLAPVGELNPALQLGVRVRVRAKLVHASWEGGPGTAVTLFRGGGWQGWKRRMLQQPVEGIITGFRLPWSGRYSFGHGAGESFEPGDRNRDRYHRAYQVTYHIRKAPLQVLAQDLEILTQPYPNAPFMSPGQIQQELDSVRVHD